MNAALPKLSADMLARLPSGVQRPAYDRKAVAAGIAHIGVGAFHRTHQAEYTDDLLALDETRWGIAGINIRPPALADTLGAQDGLYTRLLREGARSEARVIGSIVSVADSQAGPNAALRVLTFPDIHVVTMTVTEKGYCHRPADGSLQRDHPDVAHDFANPQSPRSLPGLLTRALEMRMETHGRPLTLLSCDNIPQNGVILGNVVRALSESRGAALTGWIERNATFPSAMVDRIAPAPTAADAQEVASRFGYRDDAVVVGEPFRQWVIEQTFAGPFPGWDRVGATLVDNVTLYEHIKMRVLNGAQTTLAYLGVLSSHEHTFDAVGDPLLERFVRRMLVEETLPTLQAVPGMPAAPYVEQSLARLHNTAIRHRCHQIATDGSQKIVQRLLNPIRERRERGLASPLLAVPVAGWMAWLILASDRFGKRWTADDPYAANVASIADGIGDDPEALVSAILSIGAIFDPALAADADFKASVVASLKGFLDGDAAGVVKHALEKSGPGS